MKEKHTYSDADAVDKLPEALRVNPYTVPDGYFEGLRQHILQRCRIIKEAQVAFDVPLDYFRQLEDSITARVAEEKLRGMVNDTGFSVPESYFNDLENQLLAVQKLREHVTEAGFSVPPDYFADSRSSMISQASIRTTTPIRKISRPRWMAYAAAACIALVMSAVGIFRLAVDDQAASSPLASVSDQEILNYLELYGTENDMIYISEHLDDFNERSIGDGLSEGDIEAYLNHML